MFNCVSSRDNLPTIKDGAYILNYYLLKEMKLCTLILLELNVFPKKY